MYTAAILADSSSKLLHSKFIEKIDPDPLGFIFETKFGQRLPHHMTINLGPFNDSINSPEVFGSSARLWVDHFLYNENICCAVVKKAETLSGIPIFCANKNPHITVCLRPPTRPVESNKLFTNASSTINIEKIILDAFIDELE